MKLSGACRAWAFATVRRRSAGPIVKSARLLLFVGTLAFTRAALPPAGQSPAASGRDLINAGRYAEACRSLESDLAEHPKDAEARALLGWAYMHLGKKEAAMDQLEQAARLAPQSPSVAKLLARAYIATMQNQRAEPILVGLTARTPDDPEAWQLLGRLYQASNRFGKALPCLERALQLNPKDVQARASLGITYLGLGRHDDALAEYRQAVALNAKLSRPLAWVHASFAIFLLRLNRVDEARAQIERAEAIDPAEELARSARQILRMREKSTFVVTAPARILDPPVFKDRAKEAGIQFVLENSPTAARHQIETMPGGIAAVDFDQDGFMDLYFTNGALSPSLRREGEKFWNRLYRNRGNGTFEDVTARAGVQGRGYMMAAAAADYDNDGFPDLFVAGVGANLLYHNNRNGTFTDVTAAVGLDQPHPHYGRMWSIHGLWLDYDQDGRLDLFVVNYCRWNPDNEPV